MHGPGQLAIYAIVPLTWHHWTVGEYLGRLHAGLAATLADLHTSAQKHPGHYGLWGRAGQLAAVGVAVNNGIAYHGAFLNVDPSMHLQRAVAGDRSGNGSMSSLAVERKQPVKMSLVRSILVSRLAAAFGCERFHLYSGHPLVRETQPLPTGPACRVG